MPGLKQRECDSRNILRCRGRIIYPRIDAGRECCPQGFKAVRKIVDAWAQGFSKQGEYTLGTQIQNYTPSGLVGSNIFRNGSFKHKSFHPLTRDMRDKCLVPISVEVICFSISSRNPIETQSWAIFARVRTDKRSAGCNHDDSLEDDSCAPFFKLKFLIHTLRHIFYSPSSSNIHGECDFASSVSGNQLRKYTFFCVFLKKIYIANGRKIKVNSTKKYVKFLSGGYFFVSCISHLIR